MKRNLHLLGALALFTVIGGCLEVPGSLPEGGDSGSGSFDQGAVDHGTTRTDSGSRLDVGVRPDALATPDLGADSGADLGVACPDGCMPGTKRCDPDAANPSVYQRCALQVDGCGVWEDERTCDTGQRCREESGCYCLGTTCMDGEFGCLNDTIRECSRAESICGVWSNVISCPESAGLGCTVGESECTVCECTRGAERCVDSMKQSCVDGRPGCAEWIAPSAPHATAAACADRTINCTQESDCQPCGAGFYCPL